MAFMPTSTSSDFAAPAPGREPGYANAMSPMALQLLVECFTTGINLSAGLPAVHRAAVGFLMRSGLIAYCDPQAPVRGLKVTKRGEAHVRRLLGLPIRQEAQETVQNGPGDAAPRYEWAYGAGDGGHGPSTAHQALADMLSDEEFRLNQMTALVSSLFIEALTWDQQTRVLERLGWRKVS